MTIADVNPDFPLGALSPGDRHAPARTRASCCRCARMRKDGTLFPSEVSFARLDIAGEVYVFGVARDITERTQMEAAQRQFGQRMLEVLDAERRRLARELHEDVGRAVATIDALLDTLERTPGAVEPDLRPTLAATHATVRQITESVARLVHDTHPAELLGQGLEPTRAHARPGVRASATASRSVSRPCRSATALSAEHELHLYRIVQEALTNVAPPRRRDAGDGPPGAPPAPRRAHDRRRRHRLRPDTAARSPASGSPPCASASR